jgi:ADP-ribose pyrophosphatase YjhB (NUDIX family)
MADITFSAGDGHFIYKVGAVIIRENKVLMMKNEYSPYYYTVGGRVRFGETSQDAVLREVREEIGIELEIERLAFVHENFFNADFLGGAPCHEIAFYYLMKQPDDDAFKNITCESFGGYGVGKESLHWLALDELAGIDLFPLFYKTELQRLREEIVHLFHVEH